MALLTCSDKGIETPACGAVEFVYELYVFNYLNILVNNTSNNHFGRH